MKIDTILIILFVIIAIIVLLAFVYQYKLPKIKCHNDESPFNSANFSVRNLIREDKLRNKSYEKL